MVGDFDLWLSGAVGSDVLLASRAGGQALATRQAHRLASLLAGAVRESAFYRELYAGLDLARTPLQRLPMVSKTRLMNRLDDWVTDPAVRLDGLQAFVADASRIGEPYLGRYIVWQSSGSGGVPGIFVQDAQALAVCDALDALRRPARSVMRLWDPWYLGEDIAFVGATQGHFASTVSVQRLRRLNPALARKVHQVSFLQPLDCLVSQLDTLRPTILATYPSEALLLAEERLAGRLHIDLHEVWTGGETLTAAVRALVQQAFRCPVVDSYGASEFLTIACECTLGHLHLNCDWCILEPVDGRGQPVKLGEYGATTLLTNLANRVQPLIRYDLGDRVAISPQACECGSALPTISVQGRSDDCLSLRDAQERPLHVSPLALSTVLEEDAGLFDFQLRRQSPHEVHLCTPLTGDAAQATLRRARKALTAFLAEQGASDVAIHCLSGRTHRHGSSGKVQRVMDMGCPAPD